MHVSAFTTVLIKMKYPPAHLTTFITVWVKYQGPAM